MTKVCSRVGCGKQFQAVTCVRHCSVRCRILEKVDGDGPVHRTLGTPCWIWQGAINRLGYGKMSRRDVKVHGTAHRAAWEAFRGPIIDGLSVLHHCDVRACCNPDHLFLGTHQDNMDDMMSKGRKAPCTLGPGEQNPASRLTDETVRAVADAASVPGVLVKDVAARYGVSSPTVSNIVSGHRWSHLGVWTVKRRRVLVWEAAVLVLRETGNTAVMVTDDGLIQEIARRAEIKVPDGRGWVIELERKVLAALTRCHGELVPGKTRTSRGQWGRIFYLPEHAPDAARNHVNAGLWAKARASG